MELITGKITEKVIELIVAKLVSKITSSKSTIGSEIDIISQFTERDICIKYANNYASKFLKTRTLHSAESDVFLDEIYTPLDLTNSNRRAKITINEKYSIKKYRSINIVGIAGQGKSTILRKIFLEEMKRGDYFPLFIELRRINNEHSIIDHLMFELTEIGVSCTKNNIENFLSSGRALLLLDGFDEVHSTKRMKTLREIMHIENKYNTKLISTSRPDTEVCIEPGRENLFVRELDKNKILNILEKLDRNTQNKEINDVIKSNILLQEILKTPILVNLFYVCYPYLDTVPRHAIDFYNRIFMTLYSRHDKIKNFSREKYSNITASKAQDIFDAFSYFSLINDDLEFTEQSLVKNLKLAFEAERVDEEKIENIKSDIISITCLIQSDGFDRYVYLHKSIQEFHAARFIANLDADLKRNIYTMIESNIISDSSLDNVVKFLQIIDKKDFFGMLIKHLFEKHEISSTQEKIEHKTIEKITKQATAKKTIGFNYSEENKTYEPSYIPSPISGSVLPIINLIKYGERFNDGTTDQFTFEKIIAAHNNENQYTQEQIELLHNKRNKTANKIKNDLWNGDREYDFQEYLITFGIYNDLEKIIKEVVEDFHIEYLKPSQVERDNMKNFLAKNWLKK